MKPYRIHIQLRRKSEPQFEQLWFNSEDYDSIDDMVQAVHEQVTAKLEEDMDYQYETSD